MQLTQQVIGLDSVPDAKFIKIEKKGGSLKDLTHTQKKKKTNAQTKSKEST